jgi:methanethiol S-methyltransferase
MWRRSMAKIMVATALYGAFHSALASLFAKRRAGAMVGERNRNGLYRVFYIAQSLVTFGVFASYAWRQPHCELYRVRGPLSILMHLGQASAMVYATWAASQVGIRRITGLGRLVDWWSGELVDPEPEAQGPALDGEGGNNPIGPFAFSRHPLNFVPVVIFWLWPRMNTNLLAFNLVATLYLVLGSVHEEARLREVYGARYESYLKRGVSFYLPVPSHNPLEKSRTFVMGERSESASQGE